MGVMPLTVDNSVEALLALQARLNEGKAASRVPPGAPGVARRDEIIVKLTAEWPSNDPDLLGDLKFWPGLSAGGGQLQTTVHDQVHDHFELHWGNSSVGWFPNIPHKKFKRVLTRGFLAALLRARALATPAGQLPIGIVWICSSPDPESTEVNVEHFVTDCELVVTIATPIPSVLVGKVKSPTNVVLQSYKNIFSIYAAAAAQILAARIEQLESNEDEYTSIGIDSTSLLAELKALQDALPPTYERAQQIDDDPVAGAARPRIAIETVPSLDERVEDGVDPDPPPPAAP